MTGRRGASLIVLASLLFTAACSSSHESSKSTATSRSGTVTTESANASADASTTTAAPGPTTTTTIPLYSFDDSVPPPNIIDTGTDYVAIYRSLSLYNDWLNAHRPDKTLVANAYVVGSPIYDRLSSNLVKLTQQKLRLYDLDHSVDIELADTRPGIATLRLTEHLTSERLVDTTGKVTSEEKFTKPLLWIATLSQGGAGPWRIANVERVDETGVHL